MKNKVYLLSFILFLSCFSRALNAQPYFPSEQPVFNDEVIPRIDILIDPADLASIYANIWSDFEYPATFIFNDGVRNDTVLNVGYRLRGNTSRSSAKKSFKVAFNSFDSNQKYNGLEKMNLNGEHNDPSVVRSKLCWDLLRDIRIPAPRSNHVDLYINGDYYGLYINVEHIDEEFAMNRFGNKDGNLFKCIYPSDLNFISNNPNDYKNLGYELKTNKATDDFSDLAHFIDVLNNTPINDLSCELKKVFNVEDYLKAIAFDVLTANWDGPLYNKNNFYLYHNTETDRFEYIPYDLDNTFGIDWFGVDWGNRDMYQWSHPSEDRPLFERLMQVPEFKDQYTYLTAQIIQYHFDPQVYFDRIDAIKNQVSASVQMDTYYPLDYGFNHNDFLNSFDQPSANHDSYGIKPFITERKSASDGQLNLNNIAPIIKYVRAKEAQINEPIIINAYMEDDDPETELWAYFRINGGVFDSVKMRDNGSQEDFLANDRIYGALLPSLAQPGIVEFHLIASDPKNHTIQFPCYGQENLMIDTSTHQLYINEFLAINQSIITDNFGEDEDWIELYNGDDAPVWLGDVYLTDNLDNKGKWQLPDTTLNPGEFFLIWADEDSSQGVNHANFRLNQYGESIGLYQLINGNFISLDIVRFGPQYPNLTRGYYPDGYGNHELMGSPTPGMSNAVGVGIEEFPADLFKRTLKIGPNPFTDELVFAFETDVSQELHISMFDMTGKVVAKMTGKFFQPGSHTICWSPDYYIDRQGIYIVQFHSIEAVTGHSNWLSRKVMGVMR